MFIELKKLTKIYNDYLAVNEIDFQIDKNKTVGLLGPNEHWKNNNYWYDVGLVTPTGGEILIESKNINSFKRDEILRRFNFASPYSELKVNSKTKPEIYGRLYGIQSLENRINEISSDLDIKVSLKEKRVNFHLDKKIEFRWQNL